jgi:hypothetical protein
MPGIAVTQQTKSIDVTVPARENAAVTRVLVRYLCFHSARTATRNARANATRSSGRPTGVSIHSIDTSRPIERTFEIRCARFRAREGNGEDRRNLDRVDD